MQNEINEQAHIKALLKNLKKDIKEKHKLTKEEQRKLNKEIEHALKRGDIYLLQQPSPYYREDEKHDNTI